MRYVVGIDPGNNGGIAVLSAEDRAVITLFRWDRQAFIKCMNLYRGAYIKAYLEFVHSMPKQGVTSMFSFGESFGFIQGVLEAFAIPYEMVNSQKWKKHFGLLRKEKSESIEVCKKIYPKVPLIPKGCRVEKDGLAEAVLIGYYGLVNGGDSSE